MDTKPFLRYDSASNKVKPLGFLGKEVNDTKAWTEISQMLVEAGRELRMVLPVIKLDKKEARGKYGKGVGAGDSKRTCSCREGLPGKGLNRIQP